jgi:putative membrane protein
MVCQPSDRGAFLSILSRLSVNEELAANDARLPSLGEELMSTPAPVAPSAPRKGFHLPVWVVAVAGGLTALLAILIIARAFRHRDGGRFDGRGFDGRGMDGHHVAHPFLWLIVVAVVIGLAVWGIVALVRHNSRSSTVAVPGGSPVVAASGAEEVLAQRFARGEIDEAEFRARRDTLRS